MPQPLHRLAVILVALRFGACGGELAPVPATPEGLPYSFAVHDCAPWDGPAVSIYLTPTAGDPGTVSWPNVRISVYRRAETLPGSVVAWPADAQVGGGASRCTGPNECIHATRGRVTFRVREPDGALTGFAELEFADGTALRGGFRAALRQTRVPCG